MQKYLQNFSAKRPVLTFLYYISQLVLALWLVNLAGRTLLYGQLKFKVGFVAKLFRDLSISVLNFYSKWKFKTFLYSKLCNNAC